MIDLLELVQLIESCMVTEITISKTDGSSEVLVSGSFAGNLLLPSIENEEAEEAPSDVSGETYLDGTPIEA